MYRHGQLTGPLRAPRSPIRVFRWAVLAEKATRDGRPRSSAPKRDQDSDAEVQQLTRAVSELTARLEDVERRQSDGEASQQDFRSANLAMNAVSDDLRTALKEDNEAIGLLTDALKRSRRANAALRRAEERRASVIDQFHVPNFPPDA